jgi:predicted CXXCH cytochrome family protein
MLINEMGNQKLPIGLWSVVVFLLMTGTSFSDVAQEERKRCVNRQAEGKFSGSVVHGPVSEGQCMKCHDIHASDKSKLLKADVPELCLDCHDEPMKDARKKLLSSTKAVFEDTELNPHKPFADGDCLCCHDPHASSHYRLLNDGRRNESFYTTYSKEKYICFGCHSEKPFLEPRTLTETKFRNGNLNLHYRHVNRKKGRSCKACHHHHASKYTALIREQAPFGKRDISITEFTKTENGGKCAPSCHSAVYYDRLEPFRIPIKVTEREGEDAAYLELLHEVNRLKEKQMDDSIEKKPVIHTPLQ